MVHIQSKHSDLTKEKNKARLHTAILWIHKFHDKIHKTNGESGKNANKQTSYVQQCFLPKHKATSAQSNNFFKFLCEFYRFICTNVV